MKEEAVGEIKEEAAGVEQGYKEYAWLAYTIKLVTHQNLRIKITKGKYDRIGNRINLSFSVGAPNDRLTQDMIL